MPILAIRKWCTSSYMLEHTSRRRKASPSQRVHTAEDAIQRPCSQPASRWLTRLSVCVREMEIDISRIKGLSLDWMKFYYWSRRMYDLGLPWPFILSPHIETLGRKEKSPSGGSADGQWSGRGIHVPQDTPTSSVGMGNLVGPFFGHLLDSFADRFRMVLVAFKNWIIKKCMWI